MPLAYEIDPARRYVHVAYARQPTFQEWETAMREIFADPRREPTFGILLDRRKVPVAAHTTYIRRMVSFIDSDQSSPGVTRWAIVVGDMASFGVGRMAEQIARLGAIRTFRDFEEACKWLSAE